MQIMITIGFSCSHDAGVVVLKGAEIVFAANEERYSRLKFASGFPFGAMNAAIQSLEGQPIDLLVMDGKMQSPHGNYHQYNILENQSLPTRIISNRLIGQFLLGTQVGVELGRLGMWLSTLPHRHRWQVTSSKLLGPVPLTFVDHHVAHGASTALLFSKGPGLVLTLDAIGEGLCSRSMLFDGESLNKISRIPAYHSLGLLYSSVNRLLGFKPGQEGKVTGLAAHGRPDETSSIFARLLAPSKSGKTLENTGLGFGPSSIKILERHLAGHSAEDIAAGVQRHLEMSVLELIRQLFIRNTGIPRRLYVAGGVFANVSLNRRIAEDLEIEVYVGPNMGDGGLGLGAALLKHNVPVDFDSLYLGDVAGDVSLDLLEGGRYEVASHDSSDLASIVADDLAAGSVVGVCRGRMEYGPRALGNRSILARADDPKINQWLNNRLNRTDFMPFAPIVRDVDARDYFELTQRHECYENMTVTCLTTQLAQETCSAIVHLDKTARPQVVTKRRNPWVFDVLSKFKLQTGCGVLINTSFNIHEEPIVRNSDDAFRSFESARLDVLVTDSQRLRPKASIT